MKAPAFQLYVGDFYLDTAGWSATAVGVYLRLLLYQWAEGPIENKMSVLARIGGVDVRNMHKLWFTVIAKKFTTDDTGMLFNKRLEETRQGLLNYKELQREKGILGAEKRWHSGIAVANERLKPKDSSSSSSSSSNKKEKTLTHFASKEFDAWWVKYPHRNGKKVTKNESISFLKGIKFKEWDLLMTATENYEKSEVVQRGFAKDPIRFLKKSYWKDWVDAEHTPSQQEDEEIRAIMENTRRLKESK